MFKIFVFLTRLCATCLLIALDAWGIPVFTFVKNNLDYLTAPPFPLSKKRILAVEGLTGPFATALTTGNVFAAIIVINTPFKRPRLLIYIIYIGLLDLAVSAVLLWTAIVQSEYIGLTKAQCTNGSAGGKSLIYIQRARDVVTEYDLYGYDPCEVYLQIFYIRAVTILFYTITAISLIIGCGLRMRKNRMNQIGGPRISIPRWLLSLPFLIAYYIIIDNVQLWLGFYLQETKCTPPAVQNRAKQWRAFRKWMSFKGVAILDKPNPLVSLWRALQRRMRRTSKPSQALVRALRTEHIASRIVGHLHHVELVSFSLSCRTVHEALYPDGNGQLRERTCHRPARWERIMGRSRPDTVDVVYDNQCIAEWDVSECWGCGIRVCKTCSTSRKIRGTHVSYHMTQCGAQCGNCFAAEWKVLLECKCEDRRRRSYDTSTEPSTLWRDREVWLERHLCRDCSKEATETLLDWREGRDRHDHHQAVRESLNCLTCREPIQDAVPLWWVCKTCKFECRSLEHPWRKEVNV